MGCAFSQSIHVTVTTSIWKAAAALDKVVIEVISHHHEIERLQALLDWANLPKHRKVNQNPNEQFVNLVEILVQGN